MNSSEQVLKYLMVKEPSFVFESKKAKMPAVEKSTKTDKVKKVIVVPDQPLEQRIICPFEECNRTMVDLLGGKGANLAEMVNLGLPVPPGFTITTNAYREFQENKTLSKSLKEHIDEGIKELEQKTKKGFGDPKNPLLVSVRSGAPVSMPGMMDTILNVGMNEEIVNGLIKLTKNKPFVYDTYKRFVKMFGETVLMLNDKYGDTTIMEDLIEDYLTEDEFLGRKRNSLIKSFLDHVNEETIYGRDNSGIPSDPKKQLYQSIEAVFQSWNGGRAKTYRDIHNIPSDLGTAVNIQTMVFGNYNKKSFTGVCFSRDTDTGQRRLVGEILFGAQGEDVVSGAVTPTNIEDLNIVMYRKLKKMVAELENHYRDIQDIEFTKEGRNFYILQTRRAKRTPLANIVATLDMVDEGFIDKKEAIKRISEEDIKTVLNQTILDPNEDYTILGHGESSMGITAGKIAFTSEKAIKYQKQGYKAILVKKLTDTDDISGMRASEGILTAVGGQTSHAAVVARGMNKVCVAGCQALKVYDNYCYFKLKDETVELKEGDYLTLNGTTGEVIKDIAKTITPDNNPLTPKLEDLIEPYLREEPQITDVGSVKELENIGDKDIGIFGISSWILARDNLNNVRKYLKNPRNKKNSLDHVTKDLAENYATIFSEAQGAVYCDLFSGGVDIFIPSAEIVEQYSKILSKQKDLFYGKIDENQTKWLTRAEVVRKSSPSAKKN